MAFSQQERRAQRYAPRPDFLPVASMTTCPSGVRTTRSNSRFDLVSRQAMQVRSGICLGRLGCLFPVLAIALFPIFTVTHRIIVMPTTLVTWAPRTAFATFVTFVTSL